MRFQLRTLEWSLVPKPLLSMPFWRKPVLAYARPGFKMRWKLLFCGEYIHSEVLTGCNDMNFVAPRNYFLLFCFVRKPDPHWIFWQGQTRLSTAHSLNQAAWRKAGGSSYQPVLPRPSGHLWYGPFFKEIVSNNCPKNCTSWNWLEGLTQVTCILWNALELRDLLIHSLKIPSKQSWCSVFCFQEDAWASFQHSKPCWKCWWILHHHLSLHRWDFSRSYGSPL